MCEGTGDGSLFPVLGTENRPLFPLPVLGTENRPPVTPMHLQIYKGVRMKKGTIALITAGVITAMLCSCGKNESEKETMKENDKIEVTGDAAGIDKDSFAAGIKTEDPTMAPGEETPGAQSGEEGVTGSDTTPTVTET